MIDEVFVSIFGKIILYLCCDGGVLRGMLDSNVIVIKCGLG